MKKVLIATGNAGKVKIYTPVLNKLNKEILSLNDFNITTQPEENGIDVIENAVIKAKYYYELTGIPVIANDSALYIDKLNASDQPGLFVRRFQGKELTDQELIDIYVKKLNEVGGESEAHYDVGLAIIDEFGKLHTKLFQPKFLFINKPSTIIQKGIPLSSLAYDKKSKKYMSEMNFEERKAIEGKAFIAQEEFIKEILDK